MVEFGDKVVREVMTPRPNIVAISADATLEQLRQLVINEQYSRIPVYEQNIDQSSASCTCATCSSWKKTSATSRTVRELVRPISFVPETKPVNDLMRQMQQENTHMVIVVDEYGNTAGLATMEDLLEVIIGEIRDEHEPDSDVIEDGQGGYIVSGNFDLDRVADLLETFHREEDIESTTVGGLVSEWLGRVPKAGEVVDRDGIRVEVLASDELRVEQVRHQQVADGSFMNETFQVRLRLADRPPQRRQIHAAERAGRPEGGDRGGQAADHAHLDPGCAHAGRTRRSSSSIRPASTRPIRRSTSA